MELNKRLIKVEFFKSSGPGGQHKNKRETAVKLTHLPSKIAVVETRQRSQTQNLKNALNRLAEKIEKLSQKNKKRIPTKTSKLAREKRLREKKLIGKKKQFRHKNIQIE